MAPPATVAEDEPRAGEGASPTLAEPTFDLIVANLPYVAEREWVGLEPEVTEWEPREALLAGPDGLDAIRALPRRSRSQFVPLSAAKSERSGSSREASALEVGDGQAEAVGELLVEAGFGAGRDAPRPGRHPARRLGPAVSRGTFIPLCGWKVPEARR